MENTPPAPDSFRKLIHDLNQVIFLLRGHCDLAKAAAEHPEAISEHLEGISLNLNELQDLADRFRAKQKQLAPEE